MGESGRAGQTACMQGGSERRTVRVKDDPHAVQER